MNNKFISISIIVAGALIMGILIYSAGLNKNAGILPIGSESAKVIETKDSNKSNVSIIDGKQIIEIKAKGGYYPQKSFAKAGIPTILRFNTSSTFDCSSSIRIPSIGVSRNLNISGSTDIDLGIQKIGKFQGSCGMGMYPFEIEFTN